MARTLAKRRRRSRRGTQELSELNWGDRYPKVYDEPEEWLSPEDDDEEYDGWDDDGVEDWDDDWEPPPGVWDEDDLD